MGRDAVIRALHSPPLVETEEDTLAPMTAVGSRQAAVVIGSGATVDIAIVE